MADPVAATRRRNDVAGTVHGAPSHVKEQPTTDINKRQMLIIGAVGLFVTFYSGHLLSQCIGVIELAAFGGPALGVLLAFSLVAPAVHSKHRIPHSCKLALVLTAGCSYLLLLTLNTTDGETGVFSEQYFRTQWPLIQASASRFTLHQYFALNVPTVSPSLDLRGVSWSDMILTRMVHWAALQKEGTELHMVEKDKCVCQQFLHDANVSRVPLLATWSVAEWSADSLRSKAEHWEYPVIIKIGHIQGAAASKRVFQHRNDLISQIDNVANWASSTFGEWYDDSKRPWADSINVLYRALRPCVLVHKALTAPQWKGPAGIPVELKIEVIWGRAYLAYVESRRFARPTSQLGLAEDGQAVLLVLRDNKMYRHTEWRFQQDWAAGLGGQPGRALRLPWTHAYQQEANRVRASSDNPDPVVDEYSWLLTNRRMDKAFELAEQVAAGLGADSVRVDIFMPSNHQSPIVNEISFSSGHYYRHHERWMARAWAWGYKLHSSGHGKHYNGTMPVPQVDALRVL